MRIALIASPFISVPPKKYGGTEMFIAQLAEGLTQLGIDVVVYANGESTVNAQIRWLYSTDDWPIEGEMYASLKDLNHTSWSVMDCWRDADIVHLNNAPGLAFSRLARPRWVYTVHHPHLPELTTFYKNFRNVEFVAISNFQREKECLRNMRTIHHGIDLSRYHLQTKKAEYLSFLGRIAPMKGLHNAIEIAKRCGIPLKFAGEVQPMFREYFQSRIKPHIDGKFIEYIGEADLAMKNELLGNSMAMLFPIEWDEPFGLVMLESMATGTPVIAFARRISGGDPPRRRQRVCLRWCGQCSYADARVKCYEVPPRSALTPSSTFRWSAWFRTTSHSIAESDEEIVVEGDRNFGSQAAA